MINSHFHNSLQECSWQVNFKNIDFHNRAPRYTRRIELIFKGTEFSIEAGWQSKVDGGAVSRISHLFDFPLLLEMK